MDFDSFSTEDIANTTLLALGFHISSTKYHEERSLCFTDVIDLELNAEPAIMDNLGQVVTNLEEEVVKKKNKHAAKRKERLAKLCAPIRSPLSFCPEFFPFLLPCFVLASIPALVPTSVPASVPALVPTLEPALIPALVLAPVSTFVLILLPTFVLAPVPALVSRPRSFVVLLSRHASVFYRRIPTLLLPFLSMLGPLFFLGSSPLRIFKRFLLDKPRPRILTSPAKPLCLFLALDAYNLTDNNKRKWDFDTAFINSRPLAGNHN